MIVTTHWLIDIVNIRFFVIVVIVKLLDVWKLICSSNSKCSSRSFHGTRGSQWTHKGVNITCTLFNKWHGEKFVSPRAVRLQNLVCSVDVYVIFLLFCIFKVNHHSVCLFNHHESIVLEVGSVWSVMTIHVNFLIFSSYILRLLTSKIWMIAPNPLSQKFQPTARFCLTKISFSSSYTHTVVAMNIYLHTKKFISRVVK